jgi:hypothetical protein
MRSNLQQKRGLANARITAEQRHRAWNNASTENTVELTLPRSQPDFRANQLGAERFRCSTWRRCRHARCGRTLLQRIPRRAMGTLALPLERLSAAFGTHKNGAGACHQGICKDVGLKFDRCASRPTWLGCAARAADCRFVTANSDLSRGNASVCRRISGWGGGASGVSSAI